MNRKAKPVESIENDPKPPWAMRHIGGTATVMAGLRHVATPPPTLLQNSLQPHRINPIEPIALVIARFSRTFS